MVEIREKRIKDTKSDQFSSLLVEDYYEVIKELATALLNLKGYKTLSHKMLFEKLAEENIFTQKETMIINDLRKIRNKIVYDGFFVKENYIVDRQNTIFFTINKLKKSIKDKLK